MRLDTTAPDRYAVGEGKEKDVMDQEIQKSFNDTVGAILTFLDEEGCSFMLKKAVKSELYDLCDKKIKPLIGQGLGNNEDEDQRSNGNTI